MVPREHDVDDFGTLLDVNRHALLVVRARRWIKVVHLEMVLVIVNCDQICESIAIDISYGHEFEAGVILVYDSKIDLIETYVQVQLSCVREFVCISTRNCAIPKRKLNLPSGGLFQKSYGWKSATVFLGAASSLSYCNSAGPASTSCALTTALFVSSILQMPKSNAMLLRPLIMLLLVIISFLRL